MSPVRLVASTLILLLAGPVSGPAAAAPPPVRKIETRAFTLMIPKGWKLHKRIQYGENKRRIAWEYKSPNRNYSLRTSIARDKGGTLQKITDASIVRLGRRVDDMELVQKEVDEKKGISHVVAKTLMVRNKKSVPFLVLQVLVRPPGHKFLIGLNVAASGEKLAEFQAVAQPILESLKLKEPTALFGPAAPAKRAVAKPITPAKKR